MRTIDQLDNVPTSEWTPEEAYAHLRHVFDTAVKQHPSLMESYVAIAVETASREEEMAIMRTALMDTFRLRYPWPSRL